MTAKKMRPALSPAPFPSLAPWIPATDTSVGARVARRAIAYCGVVETSPNRGKEIDRWLRWAGVPEAIIAAGKGFWCGAFAGGVLREEGLQVPVDYANCDAWLPFVVPGVRPRPGDLVLYGSALDAKHIGIVTESDVPLTVEGNRAWVGASNNGVAVDIGPLARRDVIGFIPLDQFATLVP